MRTTNFINNSKYVVLLIGVSTYNNAKLGDIPNVKTNISDLKQLFLDKRYIGVKESNLVFSLDEGEQAISRKITDAAKLAKDQDYTLFVYYTGHGILSPENFELYFATADTDEKYLEDTSVNAKNILDKLNRCVASRKIFVVDACHSGQIHNTMGDVKSNVASLMKNYEGVHYVSACDEYSSALFPKNPNAPTYFTGALVSRVHKGMDIDKPYLTLREIVDDISDDFKGRKNMPCPQQSCVLNADMMPFALNAINKDFSNHDVATAVKTQTEVSESEWKKTVKANTLAAYYEYVEKFPKSPYKKVAQNKIVELEEDEKWSQTEILGTPLAYSNYVKAYPLGKYLSKANAKISEFKRFKEDNDMWASVCNIDTLGKYQDYLRIFPKGCHVDEAYAKIKELSVSIKSKRKFFALFFTLLILLFMIPQNSDNGNYCNSVSDTFAVRTIKKDTNKNHVVDTYNNSDFNKASKEQQADKILEAKDEMHFGAALQLYEQALSENPDNEQILRKIADLKKLINEKYDYYMVRAEVFAKADCGSDDATRYYGMALRLKPGDLKASQGIESLKVKGK